MFYGKSSVTLLQDSAAYSYHTTFHHSVSVFNENGRMISDI